MTASPATTGVLSAPPQWLPAFTVRCYALLLALVVPPLELLVNLGQGLPALLVLVAVLGWPKRYRAIVTGSHLELRFLFVRTTIPRRDIAAAELVTDPRRLVIGPPKPALRISRQGRAPLLLFAPEAALRRLHSALAGPWPKA